VTLNLDRVECKVADPCGHCMLGTPHRPQLAAYNPCRGEYEEAGLDVCTARWATGNGRHVAGDLCGAPATEHIGDSPVCHHHYERAMDWYHKYRADLPEQVRLTVDEANRAAAEKARLAAEARSIVYYLRREDGMIKIGVTGGYGHRLSSLQREHGPLRLLLAYAGTRREEREAHRRFARERIRRSEWFRPELRLLLEIQRLRNAWGGQPNRLPEQVPIAEIKAIIKAVRDEQRQPAA
jgi:Meiotically up-regulated gene 113